jgi:hypothetical protein
MNMPKTVTSNDLTINGIVTWANIGVKSPKYCFTTIRIVAINGDLVSVNDYYISKYTHKKIVRWIVLILNTQTHILVRFFYKDMIFMSNRNSLSHFLLSSPFENYDVAQFFLNYCLRLDFVGHLAAKPNLGVWN